MKLLKGKVQWMEGWANDPTLELLVDTMPDRKDLRYHHKNGLYYAERDGYVSFFYYISPGDGYAGRCFRITLVDGEVKDLLGPWSSSASAMNSAGFGPCIDVAIIDDPKSYERGYTFYSGHVTVDFIEQNKHLIEIGSGYHQKCGCGCTKDQETFVEFPEGSTFTFYEQNDGRFSPGVQFPDGGIWVKRLTGSKRNMNLDCSADQSDII